MVCSFTPYPNSSQFHSPCLPTQLSVFFKTFETNSATKVFLDVRSSTGEWSIYQAYTQIKLYLPLIAANNC